MNDTITHTNKDDLYVHFNIDISKFADQAKVDGQEGVITASPSKALMFLSNLFFKLFGGKFR